MSIMDAKEARPVDDPKALVPFGWAPGGYYCASCASCGQSHSGSDKRSSRCQDCAEALRDAPPAMTPSNANTSGLSVERRAELYDHMKLVAEANGFRSLTEAIARATAAEARADRLAKALEPFNAAYKAYVAVYSELGEFMPTASTEAEQRFAEGEREDTAKEAAFDALSRITFDHLYAVCAALQQGHTT